MIWHYFLVASVVTAISGQCENNTLLAVRQIFRHGERTPAVFYPNDPYASREFWPAGPGQLLNNGKRRLYQLGQETLVRYKEFLPYYYDHEQFYVETTDVERTHMSAQVNVAGIYPPKGQEVWEENLPWQPIPIHPTPEYILSAVPDCQTYFVDFLLILAKGRFITKGIYNISGLYSYLSEHAGIPVYSFVRAFLIEDALRQEVEVGFVLPEWTKAVYPDPLEDLVSFLFASSAITDNQKKVTTGAWFYQVITDFELIWTNSSKPKYHIYSGHDSNIATILGTLGVYEHRPGFGSTIYFELRNKSDEAIINIWYKDEDTIEKIDPLKCGFDCPLATLKKKLEPWFIYSQDDWIRLCQNPSWAEILTVSLEIDRKFLQAIYNEIYEYASYESEKEPVKVHWD